MNEKNKSLSSYPDVLSIQDIMEILKIGRTLAYRLVNDKTIPAKKLGRDWIISKSNLIELISEVD